MPIIATNAPPREMDFIAMRHTCRLFALAVAVACAPLASAADNPFSLSHLLRQAPQQPPVEEAATDDAPVVEITPPAPDINAVPDAPTQSPSDSPSVLDLYKLRPQEYPKSIYGENRLAEVRESKLFIPPLNVPTTDTAAIGDQRLPIDYGASALQTAIALPETMAERQIDWSLTSYFWQAPNTYSHPLYFQDVMLERHGHERFPALTPLIAGARFFGTFPLLPYKMAVEPACDCQYHLGYYPIGSCAPALLQRPPYEARAAVVQGAATAGAILIFP